MNEPMFTEAQPDTHESLRRRIKLLPKAPGIYLFRNRKNKIIYVGKAIDLQRRVRSYFDRVHDDTKTNLLVGQIHTIDFIQTKSEFEALLLEAKYIRAIQPKYNILARDDKSPLYILIDLSIDLPLISLTRKPKKEDHNTKKKYFGPFPQKRTTEEILRSVRRVIPYCTQKVRNGRPCFYTHIGLCDPCPSKLSGMPEGDGKNKEVKRYQRNIKRIIRILSGKSSLVLTDMVAEMKKLSREKAYEKAASVKRQYDALMRMIHTSYEPFSFEETTSTPGTSETDDLKSLLAPYYPGIETLTRIECIDIATLFGEQTTASLVTFIDGMQDRGSYRKFKIRNKGISDTDAMAETVTRRFHHPEWPYPDLLIVDGGKPQVGAAKKILATFGFSIPLVGLAKREEHIIIPVGNEFTEISVPLTRPAMNLIRRIRDEAHRFVNAYHRYLHRKATVPALAR